jgi:hypothetical protein
MYRFMMMFFLPHALKWIKPMGEGGAFFKIKGQEQGN